MKLTLTGKHLAARHKLISRLRWWHTLHRLHEDKAKELDRNRHQPYLHDSSMV